MVYTGEGFKQVSFGNLSTAVGTLNMAVAYRTKMTISPTQTGRDNNTIMLKSDHFLKDLSPKNIRYHQLNKKKWVLLHVVSINNCEYGVGVQPETDYDTWTRR